MSILSIFKKEEPAVEAPAPSFSKLEQSILDDLRNNPADWRCSLNGKDTKTCHAINVKRGVRFEINRVNQYIGPFSDNVDSIGYLVSVAGARPFCRDFEMTFGRGVFTLAHAAHEAEEARRKKDILAQLEKTFVS